MFSPSCGWLFHLLCKLLVFFAGLAARSPTVGADLLNYFRLAARSPLFCHFDYPFIVQLHTIHAALHVCTKNIVFIWAPANV